MVITKKRIKNRLAKVLLFIYFRQFKLTLGAGGYTQTLNTISFIDCENLIELYRYIVMSQKGCGFRVFANTSLINWQLRTDTGLVDNQLIRQVSCYLLIHTENTLEATLARS